MNTRSILLEGIGFVLRLSPHRDLSHADAAAVARATPSVRFQVRRLPSSEVPSAPLGSTAGGKTLVTNAGSHSKFLGVMDFDVKGGRES